MPPRDANTHGMLPSRSHHIVRNSGVRVNLGFFSAWFFVRRPESEYLPN